MKNRIEILPFSVVKKKTFTIITLAIFMSVNLFKRSLEVKTGWTTTLRLYRIFVTLCIYICIHVYMGYTAYLHERKRFELSFNDYYKADDLIGI